MKESRLARRTDVERVEEYIQHQRQALEACTGDSGEDRSRPWLKNTLATFYGETNHFQEPHRLLQVTTIQKRQRLAPQTILTYLDAQTEIPAPPVAPAATRQEPAAQRQKPAEMKKQKKAKDLDNNDCIVCHHFVKRIDRHLLTVHGAFLTALDMQLIKEFYRFRECSERVLMCYTCNRRFISKSTQEKHCSGQPKRLEIHRNVT